jgi:uncharacterized protein (DUF305 family)/uncharacterized membrane protein
MMGGFDDFMGSFGWLWMLLPILFWGGLLLLIAWAVVRIFPGRRGGERPEVRDQPAEEILRGRFARGEINAEEYERSMEVFRNGRSSLGGRYLEMRTKYLVLILSVLAMLVAGVGAAYAQGQMGEMETGSFDEDQPFDLQFIDQMIVHHQMAIMSSEHMISDSERPELRQLAENIQESQSEQIEQMQAWRDEWYPDAGRTSGTTNGMMEDGMMEQMMGGDTADAMFLRMMIPHHQDAIDMSEEALERAEHPEVKELAQTIIDEQSAEIELMQGYLEEIETERSPKTGGQALPKTGGPSLLCF